MKFLMDFAKFLQILFLLLLETLLSTSVYRFYVVIFFYKLLIFRTLMHLKHPINIIGREGCALLDICKYATTKTTNFSYPMKDMQAYLPSRDVTFECFEKSQMEWRVLEKVLAVVITLLSIRYVFYFLKNVMLCLVVRIHIQWVSIGGIKSFFQECFPHLNVDPNALNLIMLGQLIAYCSCSDFFFIAQYFHPRHLWSLLVVQNP